MLKGWINSEYLDNKEIDKIRTSFLKSKPYPNLALGSFFNKNKLSRLRKELSKERYESVDKDLFSLSHTKDLISSDNKLIKFFYSLLSSKEFIHLMEDLTGEKLSNKLDMQSHSMVNGDYLLLHDDVVEGRGVAYIVYLSDLGEDDGGSLRLYDIRNPSSPVKTIHPKFNLFTCFKVSEK